MPTEIHPPDDAGHLRIAPRADRQLRKDGQLLLRRNDACAHIPVPRHAVGDGVISDPAICSRIADVVRTLGDYVTASGRAPA